MDTTHIISYVIPKLLDSKDKEKQKMFLKVLQELSDKAVLIIALGKLEWRLLWKNCI